MKSYELFPPQVFDPHSDPVEMRVAAGISSAEGLLDVQFPLSTVNGDCRKMLADWRDGAVVTDHEGGVIAYSQEAVAALHLEPIPAE